MCKIFNSPVYCSCCKSFWLGLRRNLFDAEEFEFAQPQLEDLELEQQEVELLDSLDRGMEGLAELKME